MKGLFQCPPWAKSFCPFRACCLYPLPWAKSFCPFRRAACIHCPGLLRMRAYRPVWVKALKLQAIYKAFALTGRIVDCHYTQGDALG